MMCDRSKSRDIGLELGFRPNIREFLTMIFTNVVKVDDFCQSLNGVFYVIKFAYLQ
jgi:hypothetical protein